VGAVALMAVLWKILLPVPGRSVRCFMVRDCGELVDGIFGKEGVILDSTADAEDAMGSLCYLGLIILGIPCEPSCLQLFFFFGVVRECTCRLWLDAILEFSLGCHGRLIVWFGFCLN